MYNLYFQVEECMESAIAAAALGAGLDAARVRRAIAKRLRNTGMYVDVLIKVADFF